VEIPEWPLRERSPENALRPVERPDFVIVDASRFPLPSSRDIIGPAKRAGSASI
jgi:hypothetical protein